MKELKKAFFYLKDFFWQSVFITFFNISSSIFEGIGIGMLIPVIQVILPNNNIGFEAIPVLKKFQHYLLDWDKTKLLTLLMCVVFVTILLKNVLMYLGSIKSVKIRYLFFKKFREAMLNKVLDCSNRFYDSVKLGHLVNCINVETQRMGDFLYGALNLIAVAGRILIYVMILGFVSWKFSLFVVIFFFLSVPLVKSIMVKLKKNSELYSVTSSDFTFVLLEILNGLRVIKSFNTEEYEKKKFDIANNNFMIANYKYEKYNQLIPALTETVVMGFIVILFLIVINFVKIDIIKVLPYVFIYIVVLNRVIVQVNSFNRLKGQLVGQYDSFNVYENIYKEAQDAELEPGNKKIDKLKNNIQFKDVSFYYSDNNYVLKNINVTIPAGRITAVVGSTWAGKSTLINLIPRFYDVSKGIITTDDIPLTELDIHDWRRKIGIVSQDVFIFNETIRYNISYGKFDMSEDEIIKIAKMANAHEFIEKMANGYDTVVGDRGVKLSGGQKQRISIARAIISNPEILILDEATSSLDTETEKLIQEAIERLSYKKTVIAIAHRLSTIINADNIIVLEKGEVVEQGRHSDLIKNNGYYKKFYDLQYKTDKV